MNLNWKALIVGVLLFVILSVVVPWVATLYLPGAYSSLTSSGQLSGTYVAVVALGSVIQFGLSAYLAAWIAGRSHVLHGFIVGATGAAILLVVNVSTGDEQLHASIAIAVVSIPIAAAAGLLRKYQMPSG